MADLSITAGSVVAGANAVKEQGIAGAAITAGQVVYRDTSTRKYQLADNDSATAAVRAPRGIALNGASDNQPLQILTEGDVTIGAVLTPGDVYYLSATPGGLCPGADIASGDDYALIGIAKSASVLSVKINVPGVTA